VETDQEHVARIIGYEGLHAFLFARFLKTLHWDAQNNPGSNVLTRSSFWMLPADSTPADYDGRRTMMACCRVFVMQCCSTLAEIIPAACWVGLGVAASGDRMSTLSTELNILVGGRKAKGKNSKSAVD